MPKGCGFVGAGGGGGGGGRWASSSSSSRWADWRCLVLEQRVRMVGMVRRRVSVRRAAKRMARVDHGMLV